MMKKYKKAFSELHTKRSEDYQQNKVDIIIDYGEGELVIETQIPNDNIYHLEG